MNIREQLQNGYFDTALVRLYGDRALESARARYLSVLDSFVARFGEREEIYFCSAPGRTELSGNHTDHNHGHTLAASVQLDIVAVVAPNRTGRICQQSEGFDAVELETDDLAMRPDEIGTSTALIRGVAAKLSEMGGRVGGFDAYSVSQVPKGSGLSSSAAYEILIGTIFNTLYNEKRFSAVELALAAQYAENVYFGKPSGLLDQMACASGGAVAMDFADPASPKVHSIAVDLQKYGRILCVVDTGGNHADLTDDYAAVTKEMKSVANEMGVGFLRDTDLDSILTRSHALRATCGDRALMRAFHFFLEDKRAVDMAKSLENSDIARYEHLMRESGNSSFRYLQNLYSTKDVSCQGLSLAICVAEQILGDEGVVRVHGGGFAGTVQALMSIEKYEAFQSAMETVFGKGCCHPLRIRPVGGVFLNDM